MMKCGVAILLILFSCHSFAQEVTIEQEIRMLALGDSYTIGQSVNISERWPHQLIDKLRTYGVSADYPDYIAATGWTTRNLIQGINASLDENKSYNLVSVLIGVNNQYQGTSPSSYEPDLRQIIETALDVVNRDKSKVLILSIPDYAYTPFGGGSSSISSGIDAYNKIKKTVADEYGITYVDITPISREGLNDPGLVAGDGLHPSGVQYKRWVDAIEPRLDFEATVSDNAARQDRGKIIRVYPNPASSSVTIDGPGDINRITIYNSAGMQLSDHMTGALPATIDLSHLPPGICILGIRHSNDAKVSRRTLIIRTD